MDSPWVKKKIIHMTGNDDDYFQQVKPLLVFTKPGHTRSWLWLNPGFVLYLKKICALKESNTKKAPPPKKRREVLFWYEIVWEKYYIWGRDKDRYGCTLGQKKNCTNDRQWIDLTLSLSLSIYSSSRYFLSCLNLLLHWTLVDLSLSCLIITMIWGLKLTFAML